MPDQPVARAAHSPGPPAGAPPVDPWCVRESDLGDVSPEVSASVLSVANGHVGIRGALDEPYPAVATPTLMSTVHEEEPIEYAEPGYGYPETDELAVAVPDGWAVELLVDGESVDVRTGRVERHDRVLHLRDGVLRRELRWTSPGGRTVEVRSSRMVSLRRRELALVEYEVTAVDAAHVELRPFRCGPAALPDDHEPDDTPRRRSSIGGAHVPRPDAVVPQDCGHHDDAAWTVHHVPSSGIRVAAAASFRAEGSTGVRVALSTDDHHTSVAADLGPGDRLRIALRVAWTAGHEAPAAELLDRARAVVAEADEVPVADLHAEQRDALAVVWGAADVEVDGDPELQRAVRYALLQVVQASARTDGDRGIRAKGLSGTGYGGHTFWDADTFVVPVLTHVLPAAAEAHLRWRHSTLPAAQARARELGRSGASFPWRTMTGRECSAYWPAGSAAVHITADVADAAVRFAETVGGAVFDREVTTELVVAAARLWTGLGHHDASGAFRIDGVTGPDEYSALEDDNAYTNLMAQRNLRAAVVLTERHADVARRLDVTDTEREAWTAAADAVVVHHDDRLGVTQQSVGFTDRPTMDLGDLPGHPLTAHLPYDELYRRQVVKQADVVLALHLAGSGFTPEQKRRDFDHYDPLTVRDSSLSAPTQAVVAAEVGHLGLALAYTRETALIDLRDLHGSARSGLHVAALAGAWTALVAGFGGLRDDDGGLNLSPRLPTALRRLAFGVRRGTSVVRVEVRPTEATYRLVDGEAVELTHHGERVVLSSEAPEAVRGVPAMRPTDPPSHPPGRAPLT